MASSTANYAITPKAGVVNFSTANTNRDGTGTIATLFTAGATGSLVERVGVTAVQTTTAGMIRIYRHNGTSAFLVKELSVSAITVSASQPGWTGEWVPSRPVKLPTGWSLRVSTHNGESFNADCDAADFA